MSEIDAQLAQVYRSMEFAASRDDRMGYGRLKELARALRIRRYEAYKIASQVREDQRAQFFGDDGDPAGDRL